MNLVNESFFINNQTKKIFKNQQANRHGRACNFKGQNVSVKQLY